MSVRTLACPSGEACWAEECVASRQCMHAEEFQIASAACGADEQDFWRAKCHELTEKLHVQDVVIVRLRQALRRNREGYLNILEMRKLDGEKWGQRDGYGGRYGALTREEIESVIADIDKALDIEATP